MEGFDLAESLMINKGSSDVTALYLGSELIWPPNYAEQYLTITALDNDVTVCFDYTNEAGYSGSPVNVSIEYSFDRTNWYTKNCKDWNYILTTLNKRQKLYIRGNNATYIRRDNDQRISYAHLYAYDGKYKLSGNIMSLVYGENFINQDTLTQPNAFYKLFTGASVKHAKNLIMPATTLTNYCYKEMFSGCQYLLTAPALPATSLAESCYNRMFAGCGVLTDAPELPATTLAGSCYGSMFSGCNNLINAPELPATTLSYGCYAYMFEACESLVTAPSLPATTLANRCYKGMFFGCTSLTTPPELPAMTLTNNCYEEMFYACTSLTTSPLLSARTMVLECYMNMFAYCSSLNRIVCLATDISASNALTNWVYQVAESGTFTKHPEMTVQPPSSNDWSRGENGIPTRWLIDSAQGYVITDASTNGSVSAVPSSPLYGDVVTLTASPDTGYESNSFTVTFNGNPVTVTNNQFMMPDGNVTVNGNFTMISYDVTVNSMTNGVIKSLKANGTTITPVNGVYSGVHYGETIDMEIYPVTNYDYDSLTVTDGTDTLSTSVVYSSPNTYRRFTMPASDVTATATFSALSNYASQYLTLEGTGIIKILDGDGNTLYYSINGSDWQSLQPSSGIYETIATLPNYNDCANRIRISRTNVNSSNASKWFNGSITKLFGNAMSFVAGDNFAQATTLTDTYEFSETFAGLTHLTDASNLILPATTLGLRSYYRMFNGDTSLTAVPSLPATNLGRACYDSMFAGCTSLTTAPALPATVLSDWCYMNMFAGCTSLTTAPILPASAMTPGCYNNMFYGCSLLDYVDVYAITMSDSTCTQNWLADVAATGTVKKPSILNLTLNSPNGVPTGWSVNNVNYYTINTTANVTNGTVTANPPAAQAGETVTLTLTPDLGYQDPWSYGYIDDSTWTQVTITNGQFTMPAANVYIWANFQVKSYSITVAPTSNGSVIANPGSTATYGSSVSVSDYPGSGYQLDTLQYLNTTTGIRTDIVNGIFTMPASDVVIEASFIKQTYTITIASGIQNGTITSDRQTAQVLDRVELTATPINSDYVLDTLTFTGVSSGETHDAYNNAFLMPPENVIVNGTFKYKYLDMYLTFESQSDNNQIKWAVNNNYSYNIYYSTDLDTWTQVQALTSGMLVTTLNTGDKVYFKDMDRANSTSAYAYFISTGNFKVYGNIMSLRGGIDSTTIYSDYTFYNLFKNCTYLTDASKLVLPATTLANYCYSYMFNGCTSLTAAPKELPATTLANYCYSYMFNGCSSLTTTPTLPATTLAEGCYSYMFRACSSLTTPPALPATTLVTLCYNGMFYKCSSLTTVPTLPATTMVYACYYKMFQECTSLTTVPSTLLPATTLAQGCYTEMFRTCINLTSTPTLPATTMYQACYSNMFNGCISLTTAPALPATTLANSCYWNMFAYCTSLTTAPELPATTLAEQCYENMFSMCTNLNYVKVYATDISAQYCTNFWLDNVAATGTFTGDSIANWATGTSGIPTGWTFVDMHDYSNDYLTIESLADNNEVYFETVNSSQTGLGKSIEYSTDLTNWTSVTDEWEDNASSFITLSQGQKVYLRGTNSKYANSLSVYDEFYCTQNFSLSGNIMSLIYGSNFVGQTTLNDTYTFICMFRSNGSKLNSITNLVLSATTLTGYCYYYMFSGCTGLTSIPSGLLPATTLANYCYNYMFQGCTGLTSIPSGLLPATTLTPNCYDSIFRNCTNLTSVPSDLLPATTLVDNCYRNMFYGCSSLTTAPDLPATTLVSNCYYQMFYHCGQLNSIKCLATNISARGCTQNWVNGVSSSGTFYKDASMSSWRNGTSGIPTGWTVVDV